jgi:hypothetical protein
VNLDDVKRGCNRVCIVLTVLWAAYVLLVYPLQQQARAEKIEKAEFLSCWNGPDHPDFKSCADYAMVKADSSRWALFFYYRREWIWLALLVLAFYVWLSRSGSSWPLDLPGIPTSVASLIALALFTSRHLSRLRSC